MTRTLLPPQGAPDSAPLPAEAAAGSGSRWGSGSGAALAPLESPDRAGHKQRGLCCLSGDQRAPHQLPGCEQRALREGRALSLPGQGPDASQIPQAAPALCPHSHGLTACPSVPVERQIYPKIQLHTFQSTPGWRDVPFPNSPVPKPCLLTRVLHPPRCFCPHCPLFPC